MTIHEMRKVYTLAGLDVSDVASDPLQQFRRWFDQAKQSDLPEWVEVNAMTLATSDSQGRVTSRIVLLKGIENARFVFFSNYLSVKGQQIRENPHVCLTFFWPHVERQVVITGAAAPISRDRTEQYFHSRPRDSQLGAWTSQQSAVIDDRSVLERRFEELGRQHNGLTIPVPDHLGGYEVTPDQMEFWQGRPSRLHDRIRYRRQESDWRIERLSP